ncbi:DUF6302 family protein [Streptomyces rochei]|uniref:DUF6302 family protein n=1 Tax=Streptomyces rochei TaxID=1928 RepID=UPI0036425AA5
MSLIDPAAARMSATDCDTCGTVRVPSPESPQLCLLPPQEALDYEYWARRLVHPGLLRDAVAVALHRLPLLAVPAGKGRRGGYVNLIDASLAELAAQALNSRPGFSDVAVGGSHVTWGEPVPKGLSPDDRRRFFGLRKQPQDLPGPVPSTTAPMSRLL